MPVIVKFQNYLKSLIKIITVSIFILIFILLKGVLAKVEIKNSINNNIQVTNIGPFEAIYGVEVDNELIYVPEFPSGNIYTIDKRQKIKLYNIEEGKLKSKFYNKFINKIITINSKKKIKKIHDIYLSENKNFYFTSSDGFIFIFDSKWKLKNKIGFDEKLKFPVMTHVSKDLLFITEFETHKILIYSLKTKKLVDWIGANFFSENEKIRFKNNLWNTKSKYENIKLNKPHAIKNDDNFYFIVDTHHHRILRFNKKNKNFAGWIGKKDDGKIMNRWTMELSETSSSGELGAFNIPVDLQIYDNYLYVSDHSGRIIKINKNTGASLEWFGEISKGKLGWHKEKNNYFSDGPNGLTLPYGFRIFDNSFYVSDRRTNTIKIFHNVLY
jgi:hypothetical protein